LELLLEAHRKVTGRQEALAASLLELDKASRCYWEGEGG
jgi:hypothetical protein